MTFFTILVFVLNGEIQKEIITKSERACSDLIGKHLTYEGDLFCIDTGITSSSIRPKLRPTNHKSSASEQSDHLAHDDHR